jgi:hypothetical protein
MITFVADVHVDNFAKWGGPMRAGLNDRARAVLATLESAVAISIANGGDRAILVILGDLFNRARPEPALIYAVQQILAQHPQVIILVGNHDQESTAFGHHACAPLTPVAAVIEEPTVYVPGEGSLWLIPFQPGPILEWLPAAMADCAKKEAPASHRPVALPRALCLHAGISDSGTPYYLDDTAGSINIDALHELMVEFDIDCVFAGDWHRHQRWDLPATVRNRAGTGGPRVAMQVGALAPNRFPPNYEHGDRGPLAIWRPDVAATEIEVQDVAGPRFWKARWSNLDKKLLVAQGEPAYVKLTCRSDQADEAREWLAALKVNEGLTGASRIGGTELEIDRGIERAKARTASFEARQANSLDEALARYVQAMPLSDGVERDAVLAHVRRLMG